MVCTVVLGGGVPLVGPGRKQVFLSHKKKEDLVPKWMFRSGALTRCGPISTLEVVVCGTARSMEDETRNDRRNANQNPEWWGDFS